jgi:hypothetical protein
MKAHVGVNHECLDRRPHPAHPDSFIPAHTYDSRYIYMRVDAPAAVSIGDVRRVFGWTSSKFDGECRSPISLHYAGPPGPPRCLLASRGRLPAELGGSRGALPGGAGLRSAGRSSGQRHLDPID